MAFFRISFLSYSLYLVYKKGQPLFTAVYTYNEV